MYGWSHLAAILASKQRYHELPCSSLPTCAALSCTWAALPCCWLALLPGSVRPSRLCSRGCTSCCRCCSSTCASAASMPARHRLACQAVQLMCRKQVGQGCGWGVGVGFVGAGHSRNITMMILDVNCCFARSLCTCVQQHTTPSLTPTPAEPGGTAAQCKMHQSPGHVLMWLQHTGPAMAPHPGV
jgi:hypothetical protein